ncbi:hypothetical protein AYI69_g9288 [Smittium culicis]|uniref:Uncharacterized protein n=1 Tax=Smittium culicis TaxID=133412 RepID=A0A1R1XDP9_9FUNG|nr:hypothetical protein AYI69_g9288 [Smittium culicis]
MFIKDECITRDTLIDRRNIYGGADAFKIGSLAARGISQKITQNAQNSVKSAKSEHTKPRIKDTLFENITKFKKKALKSIITNRNTEISSSGSSPVAKPAKIVDLSGPGGIVDTEFSDKLKASSKNYKVKQKNRTVEPSPTDPKAPSSPSEYRETDFFDDKGAEILKIKQESDFNRGSNTTNNNDGDIEMDGAQTSANHATDAPKKF